MSNVNLRTRLIIPQRGVARVTWSILEFYTPLNFLEWLNIESSNFVHGLAREVLWWQTVHQLGVVKVMGRLNFFWQISDSLENRAIQRFSYNGRLIGNRIWPIKWQQRRWPWMTLNVIHRLQAFSNVIRRTFVQHFARFQLTVCSPSLCVSWASCIYRETAVKRIVCARNTESGW